MFFSLKKRTGSGSKSNTNRVEVAIFYSINYINFVMLDHAPTVENRQWNKELGNAHEK